MADTPRAYKLNKEKRTDGILPEGRAYSNTFIETKWKIILF